MSKSKTKKALIGSAGALVLCFALLLGTTFAWFTDNASTKVSSIQAGTLSVDLQKQVGEEWESVDGETLGFINKQGEAIENALWEPGCTYALPALKVVNNGNLALKYKVEFGIAEGDQKLAEVLDVYLGNQNVGTLKAMLDSTDPDGYVHGNLSANSDTGELNISLHMQNSAGNDYQGKSISGIRVTVLATQGTVESDSYGNTYDKDAAFADVWDGTIGTLPNVESNVLTIGSASELAAFAQEVNKGESTTTYAGVTVNLTCDVDLAGHAWTPIGLEGSLHNNFQGTFNGNGHTIYNMNVSNGTPTGFFGFLTGTVENLRFDNATVVGHHWGGVVAGYASYESAAIENCTVVNSAVALSFDAAKNDDGDKAGAIVGYLNGAVAVKNNTVERCTVTAYRDAGALLGCNGTCTSSDLIVGNTVKNSSVATTKDYAGEIVGRVISGLILDTTSNVAENVTVSVSGK